MEGTLTISPIPTVYLSADAGRAYIVDGDDIFTFRARDTGLTVATTAQLNNFFNFYSDIVKTHEGHPFPHARANLDLSTRRARCLTFVLEAIDVAATESSRRQAVQSANRLLKDPAVAGQVYEVLLNAMPPADADFEGARRFAGDIQDGVRALCDMIIQNVVVIKRLRESWESMLARLPDATLRVQVVEYALNLRLIGRAVHRGFTVVINELLNAGPALPSTRVQQVLTEWLKAQIPMDIPSPSRHGLLCDDVRRVVYFFLDGQLSQARTDGLLIHLSICADCEQRVTLHRRLRAFVQKRLPRVAAPTHLKQRLATSLRPSLPR
ncbi:MAG TPA: zf-HC2 domain-containing protein [Thermoanaerobaculia bacterium]|nr:zf-HC2 domain-containing protein [Thermoanaerobaculia bacterium]